MVWNVEGRIHRLPRRQLADHSRVGFWSRPHRHPGRRVVRAGPAVRRRSRLLPLEYGRQ
jgi:hypothetical protein